MFHVSQETIEQYRSIQRLLDQLDPDAAPQALLVPGSPPPRDEIIVFPGSFNPPTTAHLAMLEQAGQFAQKHSIAAKDKARSPHLYAAASKRITDKENIERPTLLDRIALIERVLQRHLPRAGVLLFNRGLYVEQAEAVHTAFPAVGQLFFLIGFDKIVQILDPRYYADRDAALWELFRLAELVVAPRGDDGPDALEALLSLPENQPFRTHIHAMPFDPTYREVSSTRVRQHSEAFANDILPEVQEFIRETHAYDKPAPRADGPVSDCYSEYVRAIQQRLRDATNGK